MSLVRSGTDALILNTEADQGSWYSARNENRGRLNSGRYHG